MFVDASRIRDKVGRAFASLLGTLDAGKAACFRTTPLSVGVPALAMSRAFVDWDNRFFIDSQPWSTSALLMLDINFVLLMRLEFFEDRLLLPRPLLLLRALLTPALESSSCHNCGLFILAFSIALAARLFFGPCIVLKHKHGPRRGPWNRSKVEC